MTQIWNESRRRFGAGDAFLCGRYSLADCFFGPVAFRFQSYGVALDGTAAAYDRALLELLAMRQWAADAASETERIPGLEQGLQAQQQ